jgi:hypothetical protein
VAGARCVVVDVLYIHPVPLHGSWASTIARLHFRAFGAIKSHMSRTANYPWIAASSSAIQSCSLGPTLFAKASPLRVERRRPTEARMNMVLVGYRLLARDDVGPAYRVPINVS